MVFDEKDALDVIQKEKVDILLINEQIGGYEFVREIRKNNPNMRIYIIGVGGLGGLQQDQKKAIESGANDFINSVHVLPDRALDIVMGRTKNEEQYYTNEFDPDIQVLFIGNKSNSIISDPEAFSYGGIGMMMVNKESDMARFSYDNHGCDIVLIEADLENGWDILRKLLEDKKVNPASVIVLLGDDDQGTRKKAEEFGVSNFLAKSEATYVQIVKRIKAIYNKIKFDSLSK